jgi:hypothetical protein
VAPGNRQNGQLQVSTPWRDNEEQPQLPDIIAGVGAKEAVGDAGSDDVPDEQERHGEAEDELQVLAATQPQAPALPQRPQRQRIVHEKGGIEGRPHRRQRPHRQHDPR